MTGSARSRCSGSIAAWALGALALAACTHASAQPEAEGPPVTQWNGGEGYPGYCLADWRGAVACHDGSRRPWQAPQPLEAFAEILRVPDGTGPQDGEIVCGGALIAPDWVITAASCLERVRGAEYAVRLAPAFRDGEGTRGGITAQIVEVVAHRGRKRADLALARLALPEGVHIGNPFHSPVPREGGSSNADYVFPRPAGTVFPAAGEPDLPFVDVQGNYVPPNRFDFYNVVHVRWDEGLPPVARKLVQQPVFSVPHNLCDRQRARREPAFDDTMLCGISHDRPLCPADAGTPVLGGRDVADEPYTLLVVAVTSFAGSQCDPLGKPGRFTLLAPYGRWIRQTLTESYEQRMAQSEVVVTLEVPLPPSATGTGLGEGAADGDEGGEVGERRPAP